ncbi:acetyltransferase [Flavobacterium sp. 1355]|uniref:acetyltransferase n=1 Tax=Flavobacterium sp. 1355 TaxID=2806571 RepID=UPI001AE52144|nr:acetyltransferase [Flavobacterium sp. 1355]MBP1224039.1 sugar O-acyltransferase (sialic acid O-acetyltransferase NeuD family) [Flavobacterium sp. 1355]
MKTLAIIGSGDLGQQIAHYAISDKHYKKVVFFDDFTDKDKINGFCILGKTEAVEQEFLKKSFDELIIGIGYKHLQIRKSLFDRFEKKIPFGKIVHSSSWLDKTVQIKEGSIIYPRCSIDANVIIESNTILNIGCVVAHDSIVGRHSFLSPRVALAGFIKVEEMCIIGINATIIDNIRIVSETQIGGGAVVIKNIENPGLYVGNPVRFIR